MPKLLYDVLVAARQIGDCLREPVHTRRKKNLMDLAGKVRSGPASTPRACGAYVVVVDTSVWETIAAIRPLRELRLAW